jgi:hypothetical protein
MDRCKLGGNVFGNGVAQSEIERCSILFYNWSTNTLPNATCNNDLFVFSSATSTSSVSGNWTAYNCTLDLTAVNISGGQAVGTENNPTQINWDGCAIINPNNQIILGNFGVNGGDGLSTSYDEFQGSAGASQTLFNFGATYEGVGSGNVSLSTMQTAGIDTGSQVLASLAIDPLNGYTRTAKSTVTNNWGTVLDLGDILWANYTDAGAFGYMPGNGIAIAKPHGGGGH